MGHPGPPEVCEHACVARLGSGIPLVARDREMGRLRSAFDQAVAGTAAAILVSGDAGVGKTRLTEELTKLARDKGGVVLTGRCLDAGETGLPYLPFVEAMAQVPDRERAVLAHPALARLLPDAIPPRGPSRTSASCSCSTPCTPCSPVSPRSRSSCSSSRTCTGRMPPPGGSSPSSCPGCASSGC